MKLVPLSDIINREWKIKIKKNTAREKGKKSLKFNMPSDKPKTFAFGKKKFFSQQLPLFLLHNLPRQKEKYLK